MTQIQSPREEQTETIVRFSNAWWTYIFFRLGLLRALVNGVEDALAITGRFLLLIFLIYCGAEAGLLLSDPTFTFPGWLQMTMFCMQLAGLEGSIPGLARQADTLRAQHDEGTAKKVEQVMLSARVMTVLSIAEGALHALNVPPIALQIISAILLVVRGVVITGFLIALAKIESKAPRVLSRDAHARELAQQAQRDEQACTIVELRSQRDEALGALHAAQQKALENEREQEQVITHLREKVRQMQAAQSSLLTSAEGQDGIIRRLRDQLSHAEAETAKMRQEYQDLSTHLQTAHLHIADLSAKLERAKSKSADLQSAKSGTPDNLRPAKAGSPNITSIEQARAKHGTSSGPSRARVSHAEVIAFLRAHPTLKRAEVALQLGISERKVYDALAWAKEQGDEATSAH